MDVDSSSFYDLLEVSKDASEAAINTSYRRLAKQHHPDKLNPDAPPEAREAATQKFLEIKRAHEVLSDPAKRKLYDRYGEKGLENGGLQADPTDLLGSMFRRGSTDSGQRRPKTKNLVQPLRVSLEQLYTGATKKMAVTREVVDKKCGIQTCPDCNGRGVHMRAVQIGPMLQQMQGPCPSCAGVGQSFKTKKDREILEVHIQKGAPDGHKVVFHEKADEQAGADTGDVVFVMKEQEHKDFKRRGADLFIERRISLVEALCGFEIEVTHLDGRKLLVKSRPGEIVSPLARGFDPLNAVGGGAMVQEWDCFTDMDCPSLDSVAEAETTDADKLKTAVETQLKRQGISVGAFVIDGGRGRAYLKSASRDEVLAARQPQKGATLYVVKDPDAGSAMRMMKAVKGEGMPTLRNPFVYGNLFLILTVEFPEEIAEGAQESLRSILPPPLHKPGVSEDEEDVEIHTVVSMDPVASHNEQKVNMTSGSEAYDEDEERVHTGPSPQCAQM